MKRFLSAFAAFGFAALAGCGGSHTVTVASGTGATDTTAASQTTVTTSPASTTTATEAPPSSSTTTAPAPSTTTTARPATTTTTKPPATTTTKPAARTITLTTSPEGDFTKVLVRGAGCQGPEYASGLSIRNPSGEVFTGDGGLAEPDGSWHLEEYFGHSMAAGSYTFEASCNVTNGPNVFSYAPAPFVWAG